MTPTTFISTGHLPDPAEVRALLAEAYARHRTVREAVTGTSSVRP